MPCPDATKIVSGREENGRGRRFSLSAVELAMIDDAIVIAIKLLENGPAVCGRPSDRWCGDSESKDRANESSDHDAHEAKGKSRRRVSHLHLIVNEQTDRFASGPSLIPAPLHKSRLSFIGQPNLNRGVFLDWLLRRHGVFL
jgi:hypothetical protein